MIIRQKFVVCKTTELTVQFVMQVPETQLASA